MKASLPAILHRIQNLLARLESYSHVVAVAIAAILVSASAYWAWNFAELRADEEVKTRFEFRAGRFLDSISRRMVDYEQVLRGGVGLFAASSSVRRQDWRAYVDQLDLEEVFPGILALGYAPVVNRAAKAAHESTQRAQGLGDYRVEPAGQRDVYAPLAYVEPYSERNLRALGYDLYSHPVRRSALEQARDEGQAAMSGKVTLMQETGVDVQAGVVMLAPVYRQGLDTHSLSLRRAAIEGYIYAAFRMDDLMSAVLGPVRDLRIQIYDGRPATGELIYDNARDVRHVPLFDTSAQLAMRGRTWTVRTSSLPQFEASRDREAPRVVAAATAVLGLLLLTLMWSLATLRERAMRLARSMTRELRESRERLALALDGSNEAMFDWNVPTGTVTLSERWTRITGHGLRTNIVALQQWVHPDDIAEVRRQVANVLRGDVLNYAVEHRVHTAGGEWRWISSRAKVVERDPTGRALRVAGTNTDITDRKEVERIKNEFIATVSHELRTPLTALIGSLGLLRELVTGKLDADAAAFMEMAQQNSERLSALINDILDIEKIESGGMEMRRDALQIGPLLERALTLNTPFAEKYGVTLELHRPVPEATITGDADRLLQVLTNLVSNAVKFSPAGAAVTLAAAREHGKLRVSVTDRGPGIPENFRGRIFGKFAQADSSDTRGKGGSGLGLSISKAIVEKLGGTIDFQSTPGEGATFYFELPLANP